MQYNPLRTALIIAMKNSWTTRLLLSISIIIPLGTVSAEELQPGDSIDKIKEELGRPNGVISLKNKQILFFDRGEVTLVDGKATSLDILSEDEAAKELEKKKQKREKAAQLVEERIRNRVNKGLALKEDKLTSPDFLASSNYSRLQFWRDFQRKYPEVDISSELTSTLKERAKELEQQAEEQRVAQLEARVQVAEYRARRAERIAYHNRSRNPLFPFAGPGHFFGQPRRISHGFSGHSSVHTHSPSSAKFTRVNSLDSHCSLCDQSDSQVVSSGFHHQGQFVRRPVPPPVRFPTFFTPHLNR